MNRPHAHLVRCPPSNGGAPVVGPASAGRGNARGHPPPEGGPTSGGPAEPFGRPGGH